MSNKKKSRRNKDNLFCIFTQCQNNLYSICGTLIFLKRKKTILFFQEILQYSPAEISAIEMKPGSKTIRYYIHK